MWDRTCEMRVLPKPILIGKPVTVDTTSYKRKKLLNSVLVSANKRLQLATLPQPFTKAIAILVHPLREDELRTYCHSLTSSVPLPTFLAVPSAVSRHSWHRPLLLGLRQTRYWRFLVTPLMLLRVPAPRSSGLFSQHFRSSFRPPSAFRKPLLLQRLLPLGLPSVQLGWFL